MSPPHQTDCAATGLAGDTDLFAGVTAITTGDTTPGTVKPTLRDLIAQAQADGALSEAELIARVQGLAIAAGLEQPFGVQITMAATVMARSNG